MLDVREAVVLGWSLRGHVGIQMLSQFPGVVGLIITGTPPVGRGGMSEDFATSPQRATQQGQLSGAEAERFARVIFGNPVEPFLLDAIRRTDGRFREVLFGAVRAGGALE